MKTIMKISFLFNILLISASTSFAMIDKQRDEIKSEQRNDFLWLLLTEGAFIPGSLNTEIQALGKSQILVTRSGWANVAKKLEFDKSKFASLFEQSARGPGKMMQEFLSSIEKLANDLNDDTLKKVILSKANLAADDPQDSTEIENYRNSANFLVYGALPDALVSFFTEISDAWKGDFREEYVNDLSLDGSSCDPISAMLKRLRDHNERLLSNGTLGNTCIQINKLLSNAKAPTRRVKIAKKITGMQRWTASNSNKIAAVLASAFEGSLCYRDSEQITKYGAYELETVTTLAWICCVWYAYFCITKKIIEKTCNV